MTPSLCDLRRAVDALYDAVSAAQKAERALGRVDLEYRRDADRAACMLADLLTVVDGWALRAEVDGEVTR